MKICLQHLRVVTSAIVIAASACVLSACAAEVATTPADTVYVSSTTVPVNIETFPSTEYEGRTVYLWGGRWYYRDNGGRYSYFRKEPEALRAHRTRIESEPRRPTEARHEEAPDTRDRR